MIVDPAIAALRSEPASQRRLRAKMDQAARDMLWREAELSSSRMLAAIARGKRSAVAEA